MYDPTIGRFISEDPEDFAGGDTNLARYVKNEPTDRTDPTGEKPKEVDELLPPPDGSILTGTIFDPNSPEGQDLLNTICTPPRQLGALSKQQREKLLKELENEEIRANQATVERLEQMRQFMERLHYNDLWIKCENPWELEVEIEGGGNLKKGGGVEGDIGIKGNITIEPK
ncbi:MAG TPA: RHS repeat-associated core domain-containing protein [Pirellulales bacterium]|nr:RHS repeat-associated core domain-containing protein [Pirellulales bacterium]